MDYLEEMEEAFPPPDQGEETGASVPGGFDADQNATRRELQDKVDEIVDLATDRGPEEAEDALDDLRDITENMERAGERMLAESGPAARPAASDDAADAGDDGAAGTADGASFYQSARAGVADQKFAGIREF